MAKFLWVLQNPQKISPLKFLGYTVFSVLAISFCLHYLDDFLIISPPESLICQQNLDTIWQVCEGLGIPLALEKMEGAPTSLNFLDTTLDTIRMKACLPADKIQRTREMVSSWMPDGCRLEKPIHSGKD